MFAGNIGPLEIIVVLVIVLLIFGPKRLPGLGKQLGRGMREFKSSVTGEDREPKALATTDPEDDPPRTPADAPSAASPVADPPRTPADTGGRPV